MSLFLSGVTTDWRKKRLLLEYWIQNDGGYCIVIMSNMCSWFYFHSTGWLNKFLLNFQNFFRNLWRNEFAKMWENLTEKFYHFPKLRLFKYSMPIFLNLQQSVLEYYSLRQVLLETKLTVISNDIILQRLEQCYISQCIRVRLYHKSSEIL